jgi:membrane fusion protein (multidrug efflux system)
MKLFWNIFLVLALMAGTGAVGYFLGHRAAAPVASESSDADDSAAPTPTVQTALIRSGRIDRKITAYGIVTAQPGDMSILSVAFESRVKKVLVVAGQRIDAGTPVIELEPSPDTQLQMLQAKSAMTAATQDLEQTQRRFTDHLATNQDLLLSNQNLQQAQLKFDSLQKAGAGGPVQLKAGGLVAKVDVQEGQVVPPGGALVEIAGGGKLQVRLGVEPSAAVDIHVGDAVAMELVRANVPAVNGKVQMIAQRINPDTRQVDVFVSIAPDAALSLDTFVRGQLTVAGTTGLIVPRAAVLPDDQGFSLFTVDQDKAVEHKVTIAAEEDDFAQITGDGLSANQPVVIMGNLELKNGMAVTVGASINEPAEASASEPAATQASSQEAAR